jgi:AhpD family alkylhydroperoxidase
VAASPEKKLPGTFMAFIAKYPDLGRAHEQIARAAEAAGPLSPRELSLAKIGIALGAGLESALKSHVRRARQAGATEQEIEQVILLGMNTVGFPKTVAAWSWAQEQFARDSAPADAGAAGKEGTGGIV